MVRVHHIYTRLSTQSFGMCEELKYTLILYILYRNRYVCMYVCMYVCINNHGYRIAHVSGGGWCLRCVACLLLFPALLAGQSTVGMQRGKLVYTLHTYPDYACPISAWPSDGHRITRPCDTLTCSPSLSLSPSPSLSLVPYRGIRSIWSTVQVRCGCSAQVCMMQVPYALGKCIGHRGM